MKKVSYSDFSQNLQNYMKKIHEDSDPFIVTSATEENAIVVMSKRDYDATQETLQVLSNDYVTDKIRRGDEQFKLSKGTVHELI